jgi:hypothetical protein
MGNECESQSTLDETPREEREREQSGWQGKLPFSGQSERGDSGNVRTLGTCHRTSNRPMKREPWNC